MNKEMSALYNKATIFRGGDYKKFAYKSLVAIIDEKDSTVCLDAKMGVEIKQAIIDAKSYLNTYDLEKLPLMFNNIYITVYNCSDEKMLIKNYLREFEEFRRKILSVNFI